MTVEMVTIDEAGRTLGISRSTVWRLIRRGDLPSVRHELHRVARAFTFDHHFRQYGRIQVLGLKR